MITTSPDPFFADVVVLCHVRCVLVVYTIVLYRVEAGKVDPWEVFLYIWVIVSDVAIDIRVQVLSEPKGVVRRGRKMG